jgi:predicted ATP-binding protein involved in virulence
MNNRLQTRTPKPAYFKSLTVENVKCFKKEQTLDLSDGNGLPAQWTVILGDNNTGKTTLLRCLAYLEAKLDYETLSKTPICLSSISFKAGELLKEGVLNQPFQVKCQILLEASNAFDNHAMWGMDKYQLYHENWGIGSHAINKDYYSNIGGLITYGYGTSRRMGESSLSESNNEENTASLFSDEVTLINAEEWLLQTDYAAKNGAKRAASRLAKIKQVLTGGILPDVSDFRFTTTFHLNSFVEVQTDYGWIRFSELGYGYQTTIAWVVDLAKRLFDRYPDSQNPLAEPAIVLVDEIDLHLHPEWQRKIIQFLTHQFPRTQFIVTSHSPLVVQSANQINLVLLEKTGNHVTISRPQFTKKSDFSKKSDF